MKQQYIDLKANSIMGMGAVGPTLAILTASLYSAIAASMTQPPHWVYPVIMLVLSSLLAVFPVAREKYQAPLKIILWPIVTVVIFSAAWGTNHGLSVGEEAVSDKVSQVNWDVPSLIPSAYAQTTDVSPSTNKTKKVEYAINTVDFSKVDFDTKEKVNGPPVKVGKDVWGVSVKGSSVVYLKDGKGSWHKFLVKKEKKVDVPKASPPRQHRHIQGKFFKRWKL